MRSSVSANAVSWSARSSASRSCHSISPSSPTVAFSERSVTSRRFISTTSRSGMSSSVAMAAAASGDRSPLSSSFSLAFRWRRPKNRVRWAVVEPIFTNDQFCRTWSWIAARIHQWA